MQNEFWSYVIKDSLGGYAGSLRLAVKNLDGTGLEWNYRAFKNVDRGYLDKELALVEIKKLEELNKVAQIPNLSWELAYIDIFSIPKIKNEGMYPRFYIEKDIPSGCKGKHKKAVREIHKKYKDLFKEIEKEYQKKQAV